MGRKRGRDGQRVRNREREKKDGERQRVREGKSWIPILITQDFKKISRLYF